MQLSRQEEAALAGEEGYALQLAYRILVATGEATDADRLEPVSWAHLSGVNYNTIGDAGEKFLSEISAEARVKIKTTVNPMGYDIDSVSEYGLEEKFVQKQESIRKSYLRMGVIPSFSCVPYDVYDMPKENTRVAFAESNAAIFANSVANLQTNKESAFSALASAITGKSPYSESAVNQKPEITLRVKVQDPDELAYGMLGYFAGKTGTSAPVALSCPGSPDRLQCKAICGGMGTTAKVVKKLFAVYKNAKELSGARVRDVERIIKSIGFYHVKARRIIDVAGIIHSEYGGKVPKDLASLIKLPGVGRKTANCVLVYAYEKPAIPVDIHVHRISNRLGLVSTKTPEETESCF